MGEYEPNDSRNVTQNDGNTPGEPPRTGPREDAAREKAKKDEKPPEERQQQPSGGTAPGKQMKQPQQKGRQFQSQSGSKSESPDAGSREAGVAQAGKEQMIDEGDPNTQSPGPTTTPTTTGGPSTHPSTEEQARSRAAPPGELNNTIEDGPLQGNQPQGIDIKTGDPRPDYDQYETNQPQNMHHEREEDDAERRRQAASQDGARGRFIDETEQDEDDEEKSARD